MDPSKSLLEESTTYKKSFCLFIMFQLEHSHNVPVCTFQPKPALQPAPAPAARHTAGTPRRVLARPCGPSPAHPHRCAAVELPRSSARLASSQTLSCRAWSAPENRCEFRSASAAGSHRTELHSC